MRKVFFAMVVAGLAFAGGMLFNNKEALTRLRGWIGPRPPGIVEIAGKSTDSKESRASSKPPSDFASGSSSHLNLNSSASDDLGDKGIPAAPTPPLSLSGDEPRSRPSGEPKSSSSKTSSKERDVAASRPAEAPRPLDTEALTASAGAPAPDPSDESPPLESPLDVKTAEPKTIDPAVRRAKDSVAESSPSADAPEWRILRTRMKQLGVTRFWLEGEPDGRCRFHCLVPITAGARSVGRQFEAEGVDPLKAADSALRRIALWKATEDE